MILLARFMIFYYDHAARWYAWRANENGRRCIGAREKRDWWFMEYLYGKARAK